MPDYASDRYRRKLLQALAFGTAAATFACQRRESTRRCVEDASGLDPLHASRAQFERAYSEYPAFVAIKQEIDPQYRFRNRMWDKYLPLPAAG